MKILITGGKGYIASCLHEDLAKIHEVTRITRRDLDISISSHVNTFFEDKYFDVVIHCAVTGGSRLVKDDWSVLDDNLSMYYNLLNVRSHYKKMIHFGSGAEIFASNTPYGLSKLVISKSIEEIRDFYNLRIFAVFDENELDTRFIKANIIRYINKQPIVIHSDKTMDFFYMKDLIKLVHYYINNDPSNNQIDCVYKHKSKLSNIADIINSASDYKVDVSITNPVQSSDYCGTSSAEDLIDCVGLHNGIIETYNKLKWHQ